MWSSIIAVAGTLLGGAFTALLQSRRERAARAERRATRCGWRWANWWRPWATTGEPCGTARTWC